MPPPPVTLTFDLLTLKLVSESCLTWRPVPILVFLGLCYRFRPDVHDRQTDRQTDIQTEQTASSLNAPA